MVPKLVECRILNCFRCSLQSVVQLGVVLVGIIVISSNNLIKCILLRKNSPYQYRSRFFLRNVLLTLRDHTLR